MTLQTPGPPDKEIPWHASLASADPHMHLISHITASSLLDLLNQTSGNLASINMILIDLRRADCIGGLITSSLNIPAQSMYHTMPTLYNILSRSGVKKVVWFCSSSQGRGPRAAAWFAGFCEGKEGGIENYVLDGGIKGWVAGGKEYVRWMDGFERESWGGGKVPQ